MLEGAALYSLLECSFVKSRSFHATLSLCAYAFGWLTVRCVHIALLQKPSHVNIQSHEVTHKYKCAFRGCTNKSKEGGNFRSHLRKYQNPKYEKAQRCPTALMNFGPALENIRMRNFAGVSSVDFQRPTTRIITGASAYWHTFCLLKLVKL